jgi:hypothetical protein
MSIIYIFLIIFLIIIVILTYCNCFNNKKYFLNINTNIQKDTLCNHDENKNIINKNYKSVLEPDFYTLKGPVWPVNKNNIIINEYTRPSSINNELPKFETLNQIGTLTNINNNVYPLLGKKNLKVNSRWNYYTKNLYNTYIPLKINNKDCNSDLGCDELFTGNYVFIAELQDRFKVDIF